MKFVKGISLFFVRSLVFIGIGFGAGVLMMQFFYPGMGREQAEQRTEDTNEYNMDYRKAEGDNVNEGMYGKDSNTLVSDIDTGIGQSENGTDEQFVNVVSVEETLNADTEYVVLERDLLRETVVETVWQIPGKYIGMNRQLYLESMEEYRKNPPLSEKERGFVGLEVLSFSTERVVVQMNYEYVQPSESFYLAVQNNEVVVLLEDMETVFINTGILLEELPEDVQMKIMQLYWIEDEESLYDFLETYSS